MKNKKEFSSKDESLKAVCDYCHKGLNDHDVDFKCESQHTPTPFLSERIASAGFSQMGPRVEYEDHILEPQNALIERCQVGKSTGITLKIVRAVNAHEELIAACKLALERWGKAPSTAEIGEPNKVGDALLKAIAKAEGR